MKRNNDTATKESSKRLKRSSKDEAATSKKKNGAGSQKDCWNLRLYVAGQTSKSITAFANLKRICETHLKGRYTLEVVDLIKNPQLAQNDQIFAIPTLVRKIPAPMKKIIGDLSNTERVLIGFDLQASSPSGG